ncbi:hypothetical protein RintRC_1514 [Richelia intracellularis]|nr:hypothetical protein RintRC_1514 [Richelia intracellularis]
MLKLYQIITALPAELRIILPSPNFRVKDNYILEFLRL